MFRVKRPRHRTSAYQLSELEALFSINPSPTVPVKADLANKLGMSVHQLALVLRVFAHSVHSTGS
jgi:hypothetical protein